MKDYPSHAGLARYDSVLEDDVPLIKPLCPWNVHMEFDRLVCARGLKRFIRPAMPSDYPAVFPEQVRTEFICVEEVRPGFRARLGVDLLYPDPLRN